MPCDYWCLYVRFCQHYRVPLACCDINNLFLQWQLFWQGLVISRTKTKLTNGIVAEHVHFSGV